MSMSMSLGKGIGMGLGMALGIFSAPASGGNMILVCYGHLLPPASWAVGGWKNQGHTPGQIPCCFAMHSEDPMLCPTTTCRLSHKCLHFPASSPYIPK